MSKCYFEPSEGEREKCFKISEKNRERAIEEKGKVDKMRGQYIEGTITDEELSDFLKFYNKDSSVETPTTEEGLRDLMKNGDYGELFQLLYSYDAWRRNKADGEISQETIKALEELQK